ncbi:hypothetical protein BH23VER1_BH23VER1_09170 [soil metagenome]
MLGTTPMKSAYELAMERLAQSAPEPELTGEQKAALAEVSERFRAKIAEREIFLTSLIATAQAKRDFFEVSQLEEQKRREVGKLRDQCESEKEAIRTGVA